MAAQVQRNTGQEMTPEEVALGFIDVANETMARPIRSLTQARGYEPSAHRLAVFGGAGGQHACAMARLLGINSVIIHKFSSILSAYGMDLAEVTHEQQVPTSEEWNVDPDSAAAASLRERAASLQRKVIQALTTEQGIPEAHVTSTTFLSMRFQGTDTNLMIEAPADGDYAARFCREFEREFTYLPTGRSILVDGIRVRATGAPAGDAVPSSSGRDHGHALTPFFEMQSVQAGSLKQFVPEPEKTSPLYFKGQGWIDSAVYILDKLSTGAKVAVSTTDLAQGTGRQERRRVFSLILMT